ncbi:Gfo/Idh/MocA family protein [Spirosoma panaciterrae]|uniref:Gfo/Idh/MocA family protein n=1 Tax=Spirosoma panaciterrae TaxID=496058 RepID=UPI00036CBF05|nr:Gfo/Idh/MocA family oxidoreductase [Spirosoma panaciterrae]
MSYVIDTSVQLPIRPRPISIIGAGAIVQDAHLPAYQKAGWPIEQIYDLDPAKARQVAQRFAIPKVAESLDQFIGQASPDAVFDVAVPAAALPMILPLLPECSVVLIQKPFGETLHEARQLLSICAQRQFTASVNMQMKFIPAVIAAKNLIAQGAIGELHDLEIRMNIDHPWQLWTFLFGLPRMEMLYHSIHYMDLLKYFFGMPKSVYAKTSQHPNQMQLASTRSVIIFDYDRPIRAFINTNHGHAFGTRHQESFIKWEGTQGAIKTTLGLNINFPQGVADTFEYVVLDEGQAPEWQSVQLRGSWYPDAFIGSMADLLCFADGSSQTHSTSVAEAVKTMQLVEAAYRSSDGGGISIDSLTP